MRKLILLTILGIAAHQPAQSQAPTCSWTGGAVTCCTIYGCVTCAIIDGKRVCAQTGYRPHPSTQKGTTAKKK